MEFKVLTIREKEEWRRHYEMLPDKSKSPYFSPDYYALFEKRNEGKGLCFIGRENEQIILYPTLINPINKEIYRLKRDYYDIMGAYGYNGPLTNTLNKDFINDFQKNLLSFFKQTGVIAEFIRYCPVLKNQNILTYPDVIHALENVIIDLRKDLENIWNFSFDQGVRKAIKKGIRNELSYKAFFNTGDKLKVLDEFLEIYHKTMIRNKAENYYQFSFEFISNLIYNMDNNCLIAFAYLYDKPVSTELVLFNHSYAFGYLGGTDENFYQYSPNSFLRFELIKSLKELNIDFYSIGGGKVKDDSIYRFKKSFSRNLESRFFIGKKIHDIDTYQKIIHQWEVNFPDKKDKFTNILLKYRY